MTEGSARVTLPPGVSLERVAQVLLDAWEVGAHQWRSPPARFHEDAAAPVPPAPQDALALFRVLQEADLEYLLVGGIAMLTYVQGRNTKDVDLLMSVAEAHRIPGIQFEEETEFFGRGRFRSVQVDFLLTRNPLFESVARQFATTHRFAELTVPAATVEGLIILKLYALPSLYRRLDWDRIYVHESDIKQLLARYQPAVDRLLDLLQPHLLESDMRELRRFLAEARERIAAAERDTRR